MSVNRRQLRVPATYWGHENQSEIKYQATCLISDDQRCDKKFKYAAEVEKDAFMKLCKILRYENLPRKKNQKPAALLCYLRPHVAISFGQMKTRLEGKVMWFNRGMPEGTENLKEDNSEEKTFERGNKAQRS